MPSPEAPASPPLDFSGVIYTNFQTGGAKGARAQDLFDRFKGYAARVTLTPLARSTGYWKGLDISPWVSLGNRASDFADRTHGTVRRVDVGQRRDRYGLLVQVHDPRLSLGVHMARRVDIVESADTTRDVLPRTTERTGAVNSLYALVHPFAFGPDATHLPLSFPLRADDVAPDRSADPYQRYHVVGATWELNRKTSVTLDSQTPAPKNGSHAPDLKTY